MTDSILRTALAKGVIFRIIAYLEYLLSLKEEAIADQPEWGRVVIHFKDAGICALVHAGSTSIIATNSSITEIRAFGDIDLLVMDNEHYNVEQAKHAMNELLRLVAKKFGATVNNHVPDWPQDEQPRKRDLAQRFGLGTLHMNIPCSFSFMQELLMSHNYYGLNEVDRMAIKAAVEQHTEISVVIKFSFKLGNDGGNLRPLLGYYDVEGNRIHATHSGLYPHILQLDPRCRAVTKFHYLLNPIRPDPAKSHFDLALLTGTMNRVVALHDQHSYQVFQPLSRSTLDPADPLLRKVFIATFPILQNTIYPENLDFELSDPGSPHAVERVYEELCNMALNNKIAVKPTMEFALALLQNTFHLLETMIGLQRTADGVYETNLTDHEKEYIQRCSISQHACLSEIERDLSVPIHLLLADLPEAIWACYPELRKNISFTVGRFGVKQYAARASVV